MGEKLFDDGAHAAGYLRIRDFDKHQHYKDRRPPWIKLYVELLDDHALVQLPYATQLLYDRLLLVASKTDEAIPNDFEWIARQTHIGFEAVREGCGQLLSGGWLSQTRTARRASKRASTPLAGPLAQRQRQRQTPKPPFNGNGNGAHHCARCPGGLAFKSAQLLQEHFENVHGDLPVGANA